MTSYFLFHISVVLNRPKVGEMSVFFGDHILETYHFYAKIENIYTLTSLVVLNSVNFHSLFSYFI